MWTSTVGLVNGKHRYLTAETFGFKINSNGQALKKRQQWTIEPFPENLGPDGSISSAASVISVQSPPVGGGPIATTQHLTSGINQSADGNDPCILTFSPAPICSSLNSTKTGSTNGGSSNAGSDQDAYGEEHENVAIKSHLGKYLAVDSFGNVTCDSEEKTETARFTITICSMSQGKSKDEHIFWAFKNVERGYYLGATDDGMVCCNAKMPKSRAELWHLHLIPARGASFFALKSLGRRRYARVADEEAASSPVSRQPDQVQLDATISWGPETLFQFKYYEGGRYSLLTSDCKLLTNEGKCIEWKAQDESSYPPVERLFTLEYHSGFLAFRDSFSHYLAAAGRSSVLRSRSIGVSRDELFAFEPAPIQVSMKATFNNRWVSIKQGVDLSANQSDVSKFETFQLTYHKLTKNWSIMTHDCNFWTVLHNTGTISICKPGDYEGLTRGQFRLIWSDSDASFSIQFVDASQQERWVAARKSGQLFLSNGMQTPVQFIMRFQNRRLLNLRPVEGSGFVGIKPGAGSKLLLEANKTAPDSFAIEYPELPASVNGSTLGSQSKCPPPIGPKPIMINNHSQQANNPFNVKLNSTKLGRSILESQNSTDETAIQHKDNNVVKDIDGCIIDNNNNNNNMEDLMANQENQVESAAAPSVASIINSFSNVKIKNESTNYTKQHQLAPTRISSSTARLASAFNNGTTMTSSSATNGQNNAEADTASVITSCSAVSSSSSATSQIDGQDPVINCDQLAQLECCYLKSICNDKYLVADDKEMGVLCEATNKACAQTWIIELRSNSSLAIRASDNHAYMQLGTNGTITLSRCEPKDATLWEF